MTQWRAVRHTQGATAHDAMESRAPQTRRNAATEMQGTDLRKEALTCPATPNPPPPPGISFPLHSVLYHQRPPHKHPPLQIVFSRSTDKPVEPPRMEKVYSFPSSTSTAKMGLRAEGEPGRTQASVSTMEPLPLGSTSPAPQLLRVLQGG